MPNPVMPRPIHPPQFSIDPAAVSAPLPFVPILGMAPPAPAIPAAPPLHIHTFGQSTITYLITGIFCTIFALGLYDSYSSFGTLAGLNR